MLSGGYVLGVCACPAGQSAISIADQSKICCDTEVQGGYLWGGFYPQCCPKDKPISVNDSLNLIQCCPSDKPQLTHPTGTSYTNYSLCCKEGESVVVTHSTMGGVGSVECCDKTVMSAGGHSYCCNPGEKAYMYWAGANFIDGGCCSSVLCPIEGQVSGNYGYACCKTGCGEKGYGCNDDGSCVLGKCS